METLGAFHVGHCSCGPEIVFKKENLLLKITRATTALSSDMLEKLYNVRIQPLLVCHKGMCMCIWGV